MRLPVDSRTFTIAATFVLLSGLVGCAGFSGKPTLTAEVTPAGDPAANAPVPADKFSVEVRSDSGEGERLERPLTGHICVQEALEQAGALKKFQRFDLELYRPLPGDRWHRMVLEFERGSHRVPPECDYAVLPGDRIIVIEDPHSLLDDLADQFLKPLGIDAALKKDQQQRVAQRYRVGD